ncbi:hypothetical protein SLEP1_g2361 [Rubroshorea leprosula]|uniref:RIC1 C-terminal alpha solenoid region domain-containing protein n=1 Tax=Rubroshorea leprosula TaxID=152421 RepID=A0AAV5HP56_9ROSI|nr:hypothetical protein SLEP1_g2361 [Rubroshorea leprosula]
MDVYQDYILVTYHPFDVHVHIFHVKLFSELMPSSTPDLQSHPAAMHFIPDQIPSEVVLENHVSSSELCLILRTTGEVSLLDLDDGRERELTDSVELFWVTCGQSEEKTNLIDEVFWLDYDHRGMQVLIHLSGRIFCSIHRVSMMSFSASTEFPCFDQPTPQAQTILHCLLKRLLQACGFHLDERLILLVEILSDCVSGSLSGGGTKVWRLYLAQLSAEKPHFSHCMEWLLFTLFDAEISRQSINKNQSSVPNHAANVSLLEKTCDLIRNFPEYLDVVVSVARKTDGRHWVHLFSAAGRSTGVDLPFLILPSLGCNIGNIVYQLHNVCCLGTAFKGDGTALQLVIFFKPCIYMVMNIYKELVIAKLEGPAVSQYCALRLLQATLDESLYELDGELVRFLMGSGREYEQASPDSDKQSPRFLGHSEFASGLEQIGQKLQMGTLQSWLDAEFLLAHMCFVKFKEWIVVLATLLRRSEVFLDLFRHNVRLWKAYSMTLQSHPSFTEYHDLLDVLERRLSSVASPEDQ